MKLKDLLDKVSSVDTESLMQEVVLLSEKVLLFLKRNHIDYYLDPKNQAKLFSMCQHYLDRLTRIKVRATLMLSDLTNLRLEGERILWKKYGKEFEGMRVSDQKSFIEKKLTVILKKEKECKAIINLVDILGQNLTNTHWNLSRLQNTTDMLIKLENKGV